MYTCRSSVLMLPWLFLCLFLWLPPSAVAFAAPPPKLDPRLQVVSFLPADTQEIAYFRGDISALLTWVEDMGKQGVSLPPCFRQLRPSITSHYMTVGAKGGTAANLFHGRLDRSALETCALALFRALGQPLEVRKEGAISEFRGAPGNPIFVGWTNDGFAVLHDDRAQVEQIITHTTKGSLSQGLVRLASRIDPKATRFSVSQRDMTQRLFGVPSLGYIVTFGEPPSTEVRLTVFFENAKAAKTVLAKAEKAMAQPTFSPEAQRALKSLSPKALGAEVNLLLTKAIFSSQAVLEELSQAVLGGTKPTDPH